MKIECDRYVHAINPTAGWRGHIIINQILFQSKNTTINKEGHCIMIQGSIHQENITIIKIYVPNAGVPKYVNHLDGHKGTD